MLTPTATEAALAVVRRGERHEITGLRRGERLVPRILARTRDGIRAAIVPAQAGPIAGDEDSLTIAVGAGARLWIEPVAATLALPGPAVTRLRVAVVVGAGGHIVLDEGALIVAAGAHVERRCTIALGAGASALVRETVVLGRDGEPPGLIDSTLRATLAGRPLLHDGLRAGDESDAHVALPPGHRVLSTICLLNRRPPARAGMLQLQGDGGLLRASGVCAADLGLEEAWRDLLAEMRPS